MTQPVNYTSKFVSTDALNYKGRGKERSIFFSYLRDSPNDFK